MIKISSITVLGFIITIISSPLIRISRDWKEIILVISGLSIIVLSFLIRVELNKVVRTLHGLEEIKSDTYVENNPQ